MHTVEMKQSLNLEPKHESEIARLWDNVDYSQSRVNPGQFYVTEE